MEANSGTGMANPSGVTLEIEIAGQEWLTHSGVTLEIEVTYDDAWTIRAEKWHILKGSLNCILLLKCIINFGLNGLHLKKGELLLWIKY